MESKPNIASLTSSPLDMDRSMSTRDSTMAEVDPDISIKQEPEELEIDDEERQSAGQERPTKRTKKAIARTTEFFRKLFAKRRKQSKIECRKCGRQVKLLTPTGRTNTLCLNTGNIRQHVIAHVDKPMYSCLHCGQTCKSLHQIIDHMRNIHQGSQDHHSDFSDSFEKDIFKMAKDCFGEKSAVDDRDDNPTKIRYAINQYFRQLYRANWKNAAGIICNLCGMDLSVQRVKTKTLQVNKAISHASIHLEKFLFSCRHCSHHSVTRRAMNMHLQKHHALGAHPGNYVDRMHEFKDELIDIFERCYAKGERTAANGEVQNPKSIKSAKSENIIRSRGGPNVIFTERQIHCHRLLAKFCDKQGSIKCRVCSHVINVQQPEGLSNQRAIWHASLHLEKALYKCKTCGKDIQDMPGAYRHMKKEHGITKGVMKECEDRSCELHKEILDALTRSFDWTGDDWRVGDGSDEEDWSEEM